MAKLQDHVWNFAKALVTHVGDGMKHVSVPEYTERMRACTSCELLNKEMERCTLCGCHMPTKAGWRTSSCPADPKKWDRSDGGAN